MPTDTYTSIFLIFPRLILSLNIPSRGRFDLSAESYAKHSFYPPTSVLSKTASRAHIVHTQRGVIEKLEKDGII